MGGMTLVAYYGERPDILSSLIRSVQRAASQLTETFLPRPLNAVHATLIALDDASESEEEQGRQPAAMTERDANRLLQLGRYLQGTLAARRISVQFGGFEDREYGMRSQGLKLYERSFSVKNGNLVLIGWPVVQGRPSSEIDRLRRECEQFGFRHKHFTSAECSDPDLYLVLGRIPRSSKLPSGAVTRFEAEIRHELSRQARVVPLGASDLAIVRYQDRSLPLNYGTRRLPLAEITPSTRSALLFKMLGSER